MIKVGLFQKSAARYSFAGSRRLEEWLFHFHVYSEQERCVKGLHHRYCSNCGCGLLTLQASSGGLCGMCWAEMGVV